MKSERTGIRPLNRQETIGLSIGLAGAIALLVLLPESLASEMHPNHVSLTEIEYNSETKRFEVSLCVWPEDLERALNNSIQSEDTIRLTKQNLEKHLPVYLKDKFLLYANTPDRNRKNSGSIRWVGSEISLKKAWLYFEMSTGAAAANIQFENRIFFELNEDQVNHIRFKKSADEIQFFSLDKNESSCRLNSQNVKKQY